MTVELCLSICRKKRFFYAGLQWQIECYCGNEPKTEFEWAWKDKCNESCAGDRFQICGGSNALSLYSTPPSILIGLCILNNPSKHVLGKIETYYLYDK